MPPQVHSEFPSRVPTQDTTVIFFQYIQNSPLQFSLPVSLAWKLLLHLKSSLLISITCSLPSLCQLHRSVIHNFPHSFFAKSRIRAFAMFPRCDQTVTDPSITVFRAGTPRSHSECSAPVYQRCTRPVHRQFIQSALISVPTVYPIGALPGHPECPEA